jgi:N12 class adenine-specific DNA methylase/predicted RNA methylase
VLLTYNPLGILFPIGIGVSSGFFLMENLIMKPSKLMLQQLDLFGDWLESNVVQKFESVVEEVIEKTVDVTCTVKSSVIKATKKTKAVWDKLSQETLSDLSGDVTKFEANIRAIETLLKVEAENDVANELSIEDRIALNRYTGWGGLSKSFNENQSDDNWAARASQLKSLLSEDEYASASESTLSAHYTRLDIVNAMWAAVVQLGFSGGKVLEPSCGTGLFLAGMPKALAENSNITAIEIDSLTARIAKSLYSPFDVRVINAGFEATQLPENFFDLVIGNVPFGNFQVPELRNVDYANFMIHDYFFAKSLEVVRPGGLVAFITSSGTMDKTSRTVRSYLSAKAKLVTAIRLPNIAFKALGNTSVTTDIIILQKRESIQFDSTDSNWIHSNTLTSSSSLYGVKGMAPRNAHFVNEYFLKYNPDNVIGRMDIVGSYYEQTMGCVYQKEDGNFIDDLLDVIGEKVPVGVYQSNKEVKTDVKSQSIQFEGVQRPGYRIIDGNVYEVIGSEAIKAEMPAKTLERVKGMVQIRDAARALISEQAQRDDLTTLTTMRIRLNMAYDSYVKSFGFLNERANRSAFKADPDMPLLMSLEKWNDEDKKAEKADIFIRRTVGLSQEILSCDSVVDAMLVSISEYGRIVPQRIAALMNTDEESVMNELESEGMVYLEPCHLTWVTSNEYLSGNIRTKLEQAKSSGERFVNNVKALETVLPNDLVPSEIGARVGATWIPSSDYQEFLDTTFGGTNKVAFSREAGAWSLAESYNLKSSAIATQTYGTNRVNAGKLFAQALNQQVPTVYDERADGTKCVNSTATIAAREKQQELKDAFISWLWSDDGRASRLARLYNDQFNSSIPRRFDGSHLTLPGYSGLFKLHQHQKDAIWRTVASNANTLYAHVVGAGKTMTMICAGMELRRLGKANKPMYVVPNHMLEQFASEFLAAYPGANILMATKDDLTGDKRRLLLSKIATCSWDAILITHATFERIKMSDGHLRSYIKDEISEISHAITCADSSERGNGIVKELARAKKTWEAKLSKLSSTDKKDDLLTFEDLGIDQLFVDEAHYFKNLYRFTKMTRVAGLPNSNSERAFDMYVKTRYIMDVRGGDEGVCFATGTPVANSMAEMWVMQKFLQPSTLSNLNLMNFDSWAANFGESVTALELSPDGSGYRMQTRFARFINIPELMSIFSEVADIRTRDMLNLPTPVVVKETITAKQTNEMKEYVKHLVKRAERIKNGNVSPSEDNMLSVTNDGRKAALDIRLALGESDEYDHPDSKASLCANRVYAIWKNTSDKKLSQIIFSDLSTPNADGRFNVYSDICKKLVDKGIPFEEIAFIHDYDSDEAKAKLFKSVREGRVRVIFGSTNKLGVGTNIQRKLVALHHLDAPWRPADVEQREGRIERQGNENAQVEIYRYVTEGSFDAYIWQTLETKAKFISQVMSGSTGVRTAEDMELAALSYAEVKALASGNPLVMEKAGIDSELAKLTILKNQFDNQQWKNKTEVASLPNKIEDLEFTLAKAREDLLVIKDVSGDNFEMTVNGKTYTERTEAAKALTIASFNVRYGMQAVIGSIGGLDIYVEGSKFLNSDVRTWSLRGNLSYRCSASESGLGQIRALTSALSDVPGTVDYFNERIALDRKRLSELTVILSKGFDKAERLAYLQQRQREIDNQLDLSKGDLSATNDESSDELKAA